MVLAFEWLVPGRVKGEYEILDDCTDRCHASESCLGRRYTRTTSLGRGPLPNSLHSNAFTLRPETPREAIPRDLDVFLRRVVQLKVKQTDHGRNGEVEFGICEAVGFRGSLVSVTNEVPKLQAWE